MQLRRMNPRGIATWILPKLKLTSCESSVTRSPGSKVPQRRFLKRMHSSSLQDIRSGVTNSRFRAFTKKTTNALSQHERQFTFIHAYKRRLLSVTAQKISDGS